MARGQVWILGGGTLLAGAAVALWLGQFAREVPPVAEPAAVAMAGSAPVEAAPPAPAEAAVIAPGFDVVRVTPAGEALVAGRAAAGAAVTLRIDGAVVAQAAADSAGQFVAMFTLAPSEAMQVMTLEMADAAGRIVEAPDTVMLMPRPTRAVTGDAAEETAELPPPDEPAPAAAGEAGEPAAEVEVAQAAAPAEAEPADSAPAVAETAEAEAASAVAETAEASPADTAPAVAEAAVAQGEAPLAGDLAQGAAGAVPEAAQNAEPGAVPVEVARAQAPDVPLEGAGSGAPDSSPTAILMRADGAVEVLDRAPQVMDNVVIDAISYSDAGDVQITGRAAGGDPAASLRIYLDNQPIAVARAEGGGDWRLDLPSIDAGIYTLRVDQVNAEGGVESRFETPFLRESRQSIAEARARTSGPAAPAEVASNAPASSDAGSSPAEPPRASLITVQPGHTLWAISRDRYGEGDRYMVIFNANRGQIRDPDWIYPGQVFALPEN